MIKKHTISFKHAFEGLRWVLKTQPNYRIHFSLSILSIFAGWFLRITHIEFIIIIFLIFIGLVIETINTGIEATTDAIDKKNRDDIKIAKDVAAASMLIFAVGSTIVAGLIFIPRILNLFIF